MCTPGTTKNQNVPLRLPSDISTKKSNNQCRSGGGRGRGSAAVIPKYWPNPLPRFAKSFVGNEKGWGSVRRVMSIYPDSWPQRVTAGRTPGGESHVSHTASPPTLLTNLAASWIPFPFSPSRGLALLLRLSPLSFVYCCLSMHPLCSHARAHFLGSVCAYTFVCPPLLFSFFIFGVLCSLPCHICSTIIITIFLFNAISLGRGKKKEQQQISIYTSAHNRLKAKETRN